MSEHISEHISEIMSSRCTNMHRAYFVFLFEKMFEMIFEQILSETADDRRKMFEEAAGIHKYRTQKRSTVRKFEATRNDLERIQDIIGEVEQKVRSLDLQLKRFKRHASLIEKLESKDIELAFVQIHRFRSAILPLHLKI